MTAARELTTTEINEAVARKLGWTITMPMTGYAKGISERTIPNYCTDIKAAWEIVDFFLHGSMAKENPPMFNLDYIGTWRCRMSDQVHTADTAPIAICLAYLKMEDQ